MSNDNKITLAKTWGHFKTITRHHHKVMCYCIRGGLIRQGIFHDLSKLSPTEFWVGARYFQGTRSPNNAERESTGVSTSWCHHKGRNKHHYEYWIDYGMDTKADNILAGSLMPRRYVAEMIFDRVSAGQVYRGKDYVDSDPLDYYLKAKEKSWFIHPIVKEEMEFLLTMWAEKGEKETIRYIRQVFLKEERKR